MNNRPSNSNPNIQRASLVTYLRQIFNRVSQVNPIPPTQRTDLTVSQAEGSEEGEGEAIRGVWNRMQNLSAAQRALIMNAMTAPREESESEDQENVNENSEDEGTGRRRYYFFDEEAESEDELLHPEQEEDDIDFRTYPLPIDWQEIENEKSEAYQICDRFGYFGVSLFSTLSKVKILHLTSKKFLKSIVEFYSKLLENYELAHSYESLNNISSFIANLPNLKLLKKVLCQKMITKKELICLKLILDLYEHYFTKFDRPFYIKLQDEFIPTAFLFYSSLSEEDILYIHEKLNAPALAEILDVLKNKLSLKIHSKRSHYIKHINKMKNGFALMYGGLEESKFVV